MPMRLGEMLIERRLIEPEDLDRALEIQKERSEKIGKILVDLGFIAMHDVLATLSDQLALPLVTIAAAPPSAPTLAELAPRFLRQSRCLPVELKDLSLGEIFELVSGAGDGAKKCTDAINN